MRRNRGLGGAWRRWGFRGGARQADEHAQYLGWPRVLATDNCFGLLLVGIYSFCPRFSQFLLLSSNSPHGTHPPGLDGGYNSPYHHGRPDNPLSGPKLREPAYSPGVGLQLGASGDRVLSGTNNAEYGCQDQGSSG